MKRIPKLFIASLTASIILFAKAEVPSKRSLDVSQIVKTKSSETIAVKNLAETLEVAKLPLLELNDFEHAIVRTRSGKVLLQITLAKSGASKLRKFSVNHEGESLAVLLDHSLLATPKIRLPIYGKAFQIDSLSRVQAEALASAINNSKGT